MQQVHYITILFAGVNVVLLVRIFLRYLRFARQRIPGLVECLVIVFTGTCFSVAAMAAFLLPEGVALHTCMLVMYISTLMLNTMFLIAVHTLSMDREARGRGVLRVVVLTVSIALCIVIATDGLHHLFALEASKAADGFLYETTAGPRYALVNIYAFGLAVAAVVRVLRSGSRGVIRSAPVRALLVLATLIPSVLNGLEALIPVFGQLRVSLFFNWVSVAIIIYLFFGYLFTARRMAIGVMDDAYVVFNLQGNCVDINARAEAFFERCAGTRRPLYTDLATLLETGEGGHLLEGEVRLPSASGVEAEDEYYHITTFRLSDGINQDCGSGFIIREVTEYHQKMSRLNSLATEDPLTGAKNRRYLTQSAEEVLEVATAQGIPLTVMMLDIDFFKRVNDVYGHLAGDEVLVGVNEIFQNNVREDDLVVRYGGEEFMILSAGIGADAGFRMAQRIRGQVEAHAFKTSEGELRVTISIGVFTAVPRPGDSIEHFVEAADQRLYYAKQTGRNRVVQELAEAP